MSNFWQGFTKKAGMFDFGLKPEVLDQVKRFNQNVEDLKDVLNQAPGKWEQAGKNVVQSGKKLDKKRLFGYAALAGGGLAMGTALGRHFGQRVANEKVASMITHALKKGLRRGRNSATGTVGAKGYRLGKTTIRYPKDS